MIISPFEAARSSTPKGIRYIRLFLLALVGLFISKTIWFSNLLQGNSPRRLMDFDAFYIVAQMIWRGEVADAYHFATLFEVQKAMSGTQSFMPWTYPPPFDLLIAPLAFLPLGLAYALFTGGTFTAYLATLKRIESEHFPLLLIVLLPTLAVVIGCGQNGFLTGTLIGLTCLGFQRRSAWAGLPLGLMIIKPHLAVAFALYTLASRRWAAACIAAATVLAMSALSALLLGTDVWIAFLQGTKEAQIFLEKGMYPLFRMISPYAALHTFGLPASMAMAAQILVAVLALGLVVLSVYRGLPLRQSLGLTAIASLLISPYAYDYDMPVFGIGLALILPDLIRQGREAERAIIYGLSLFAGGFGMAQSFGYVAEHGTDAKLQIDNMPLSLAGFTLIALALLAWRILRRTEEMRPAPAEGRATTAIIAPHAGS
ncbi:glycosyltransferase family 87 protein [Microvirga solisilvae]|uniref:glycosyltransferase family 87 protein n=1 Tax=Microvirga solisilvae TaxID=2919498 RepID=UPI001FAF9E2D|nr:glycosyltransferase family 87 protein [Microvirga solisilvae]